MKFISALIKLGAIKTELPTLSFFILFLSAKELFVRLSKKVRRIWGKYRKITTNNHR
ncbi:hypothetical protein Xszus_01250 [Xenorhabdus szentirmaii]|uniref:Uncharacterized protein n=1 Tax=Xenorhabdus szentirmaii DSM 16338 TaxID=1427518 RepID=W1J4G7_9GAMM|nr:hypothetical protein Xsze_02881 [Xenorhabdus szentirmaii DSM 16338]PHM41557.1 hypothetical protein Xszus_01250 [Xenorhabdus szentirmaii]CDL85624.1 hypothetical protein XSR1_860001 [Xenorhabdus szentirmaii DSM 16338]